MQVDCAGMPPLLEARVSDFLYPILERLAIFKQAGWYREISLVPV